MAGALLFLAPDFRVLGRNTVGTTLFVSNIFFRAQTDYFDSPAEVKPLLHTWSLGVEEQFYIFFPLLLVWLLRWRRDLTPHVLGTIAVVSLVASAIVVRVDAPSAFYLAPFRIRELLIGALLALDAMSPFQSERSKEVAASTGVAAILLPAMIYSPLTQFPGIAALAPCLGAALVIQAGKGDHGATVNRLLASRPIVFVGLISYSLYLWHWPLFVFAGYYLIRQPTSLEALSIVLAAVALAVLSWRFIEMPFRRRSAVSGGKHFWLATETAMVCATAVGGAVYATGGLPERLPPNVDRIASYGLSLNPQSDRCGDARLPLRANSRCTIGNARHVRIFLWGDSHAAALYGACRDRAEGSINRIWRNAALSPTGGAWH